MPDKNAFALDDVFEYVLGYDPYARQGLNKAVLQKSDWSKSKLTEDQLVYAATDVYFMPQVWDKVKHAVDTDSYKLDIHALNACLDFQWNGMPVLQNRLMALYEANKLEISKLNVPINVNSYQQVRAYLGVHASDDIALARLAAEGNDKAKNVRRVRKLRKQLSFIEKFDVASGIIYGKFKPSARSGRTTSSDQNLQQVPRAMKDCFGFEEDGDTVMIFSDYPQLELRTICAIVVCKLMERFFREGADLHGYTAEYLFGPNWTKNHRQITKTYNFNLLYGGGVAMIQTILLKQLGIFQSDAETASAKKKWRNLWREIAAWQDAGITK
jgi:DNA polymerase I-like protein with 3'-5' exonuclease and polymerase domains